MKKVLSLVLAVVMIMSVACAGMVSASAGAPTITVLIGDVDESGIIEITDATLIQRHLARLVTLSDTAKLAADADNDKEVSIIDATAIQRYLAKLTFSSDLGKYVDYYAPGTDASEYAAKKEYNGIDVSRWQGNIDWTKVKAAGIDFAMIRLGYGSSNGDNCGIDSYFVKNVTNAAKAGVDIGCYFYSYALTAEAAKKEAQFVVDVLKSYPGVFSYPIAFDLEDPSQTSLGKTVLTNMVVEFGTTLEDAGYYCTLYSNTGWLKYYLDDTVLARFDHWVAQWSATLSYSGSYGMWQYSSTGSVNGISGNVDLDIAYYNYPKIVRAANLNGFTRGPIREPIIPTGSNFSGDIDSGADKDTPTDTTIIVDDNNEAVCVEDYDGTATMMNSIRHAISEQRCGLYMDGQ